MSLRGGLQRSGSFLAERWWVFAIYALPFGGPMLFRLTKTTATGQGVAPALSMAFAYAVVLGVVVLGVWLAATRWRVIAPISPMNKPFGLPAMSVDPVVAVVAALAILLIPSLIGSFGQDSPVFETSESSAYRFVYRFGAIVLTPFIEEVGHRWLLYRGLRPPRANNERLGKRLVSVAPAVLISGMFFGLVHYLVAGPSRMAATMVVGVILALAYEVTGRLWVPLLAHTLINMYGNLGAEYGANGRYVLIGCTLAIMIFSWTALVRNGDDLRSPWPKRSR